MGNKNPNKSSNTTQKTEETIFKPEESLEYVVYEPQPNIKEDAYKIERQIL
jgi:hypothetical protein